MKSYQEKMLREMQLRNYAEQTKKTYLQTVERLCRYFHRAPEMISSAEIITDSGKSNLTLVEHDYRSLTILQIKGIIQISMTF